MSPYKVEHCTVADAAALARNNMTAYYTNPMWIINWNGWELDEIIAECTKRVPANLLGDPKDKRHEKAVDAETGALLGYARWILPERLRGEWLSAQTPPVSAAEEKAYGEQFAKARWFTENRGKKLGQALGDIMGRLMQDKEYLELEYLAVHPENQGRGVATLLVEHGVAEAERLGVDVIVMAYKPAVGIYKRLGFELVEQYLEDDPKDGGKGEFGAYFMVRKSNKGVSQ
ncbi:acyl-CoA N-acyltransferase [Xylariales sp. PMI_506]|nr:acyl-CoA N-acyltransferase [Xylariales sp. PMI_506]